jgi:hypothetical protein
MTYVIVLLLLLFFFVSGFSATALSGDGGIYVIDEKETAIRFARAITLEYHRTTGSWTLVLAKPGTYFVGLDGNPGTIVPVMRGEAIRVRLAIAQPGDKLFVRPLREKSRDKTKVFLLRRM